MADVTITCPNCCMPTTISARLAGETRRCSMCGRLLTVPTSGPSSRHQTARPGSPPDPLSPLDCFHVSTSLNSADFLELTRRGDLVHGTGKRSRSILWEDVKDSAKTLWVCLVLGLCAGWFAAGADSAAPVWRVSSGAVAILCGVLITAYLCFCVSRLAASPIPILCLNRRFGLLTLHFQRGSRTISLELIDRVRETARCTGSKTSTTQDGPLVAPTFRTSVYPTYSYELALVLKEVTDPDVGPRVASWLEGTDEPPPWDASSDRGIDATMRLRGANSIATPTVAFEPREFPGLPRLPAAKYPVITIAMFEIGLGEEALELAKLMGVPFERTPH